MLAFLLFAPSVVLTVACGVFLAACASGELRPFGGDDTGAADASTSDRGFPPDAPVVTPFDARPGPPDAVVFDAHLSRPDAGSLPIDAEDPPVDAPCTPTIVNLLVNPSFDLGPTQGWAQWSSHGWELICAAGGLDPLPVPPQSGSYGAWLGGDPGEYSALYQDVAVPAGALELEVAGYFWITTEEPGGNPDVANVQIRDTGGMLVEPLHQWSNLDHDEAWTPFSYAPTGNYAGQTIRVYFDGGCDASVAPTSFLFDTLAVNAIVCL